MMNQDEKLPTLVIFSRPVVGEGIGRCELVPGVGATPGFAGDAIVLRSGVDNSASPLGRSVRWRVEKRGAEQVYCSTFVMKREELLRGRSIEHLIPDAPEVEVTVESIVTPDGDDQVPAMPPDKLRRFNRHTLLRSLQAWLQAVDERIGGLFWTDGGDLVCVACRLPAREIGSMVWVRPLLPRYARPESGPEGSRSSVTIYVSVSEDSMDSFEVADIDGVDTKTGYPDLDGSLFFAFCGPCMTNLDPDEVVRHCDKAALQARSALLQGH